MTRIFFRDALLPDEWAPDTHIAIADGRLVSLTSRDAPQLGDMRFDIGSPGGIERTPRVGGRCCLHLARGDLPRP